MGGLGQKYSWNWTGIVCPKGWVTLRSCPGKRTAFCQREAVPCEALHGITEIFNFWVCCVVGPTYVISIIPPVTKCPWLDLVGICKPRDPRRDVCGRGGHVMWSKLYLQFPNSGVISGKWQEVAPQRPCRLLQRQYFLWRWRSASMTRSGKQRDSWLQALPWPASAFLQARFLARSFSFRNWKLG